MERLIESANAQQVSSGDVRCLALVGNYLPRLCGIATFTTDLTEAIVAAYPGIKTFAIPVTDTAKGYQYPERVRFEIQQNDLASYRYAADFLNISKVDTVCLQHEYGIFGGLAGSHILTFVRELRVPLVTVLHTVIKEPNDNQRRVMNEIAKQSDRLVVMSKLGAQILNENYSVPDQKIDYIPHGIHDVPFIDPNFYKDKFGVEGKKVLLTFGLLAPGKGIEQVIKALPDIIKKDPDVVFIVLGVTHPNVKKHDGESYRLSLEHLACQLGVAEYVAFYNRFVSQKELLEFIGAADIYITPYLQKAQITSGTLAYATGMGKAVISTPYWYAEELLNDDRGVLVPFADASAIAVATLDLLADENKRHAMRRRAFEYGRQMIWPVVAERFVQCFDKVHENRAIQPHIYSNALALHARPRELPEVDLQHLRRMTDNTGLLQHATFTIPNYKDGYTTDDTARGLIFATVLDDSGHYTEEAQDLSVRYLAFLLHAFNPSNKCFRNFMGYDRRWLEHKGSEDSHGRALWALGTVIGRSDVAMYRGTAAHVFDQALSTCITITSPRSWAFTLLGISEYMTHFSGDRKVQAIRKILTERLFQLLQKVTGSGWIWFEDSLTYANGVLPHALLISGEAMGDKTMVEAALEALEWLCDVQSLESGWFSPIGADGFYVRGGQRARFDQQPIEAQTMVSACLAAYRQTENLIWWDRARWVFDWFLGMNDLSEALYDTASGSCRDGLHADRPNENRGAEATLAFLHSLVEMRAMEATVNVDHAIRTA